MSPFADDRLRLVFTEGYATSTRSLADEAIRLGRLLVELMPRSDDARALLALMLLQRSRHDAREVDGERVTLEHQDRTRWDRAAIDEAFALGPVPGAARGAYRVQAELAAVHAVARHADDTDWPAIVTLYDELLTFTPSPVISLNRAIAVGMSDGPLAGLVALDAVAEDDRLVGHYLVPAARGDLLARAGLLVEAVRALELAARRAPTEPERQQLARRVEELGSLGSAS